MSVFYRLRMLYRTPKLLGSRGDLSYIGDNPVKILAIPAIDLFDSVQIKKIIPVHYEIITSFHLWDLVYRETDALVNRCKNIYYKGRYHHGPYKGYRKER